MSAVAPSSAAVEPVEPLLVDRAERVLLLLFPILAAILLWEVLVGGRLLLPSLFLPAFEPWQNNAPANYDRAGQQWNVLQWDGMAEFFPWRIHAAREMSSGRIPLWNPNVLCGTPFLANSQSAPLYPLHWLLYLPGAADRVTIAVRMGWLAWLHLSIAGVGAYLLARDFRCRPGAAALAGTAFMLSGFCVAWLELPSFIAVTCWIPFVLLAVGRAVRGVSERWALAGAIFAGMMLLAGHLQIALYGLLAASGFWLWETAGLIRAKRPWVRAAAIGAVIVGGGLVLSAPQLLPSLELSRISHRAGSPTAAGYEGYLKLAMPPQQLIGLLVPDFFGMPSQGQFWGMWSYGPPNVQEFAGSVGLFAFALALLGVWMGRGVIRRAGLLVLIAGVSLLLASGSPLDALLYFGLPGFAQSGSPARVLVLFCLAQAMLAGIGLECLLRRAETDWRAILRPMLGMGLGALILLGSTAALTVIVAPPQLSGAIAQGSAPAVRAVMALGLGIGLLTLLAWLLRDNPARQRESTLSGGAVAATAAYLILVHGVLNPISLRALAYPDTAETTHLSQQQGRVATMNSEWGIARPPRALLPPNASLAYGWRDVQGYDSLYLRRFRSLMNAVTGVGQDSSPPANGNIVFVKRVESPLFRLLGAGIAYSQEPLNLPRASASSARGTVGQYSVPNALPEAYVMTGRFTAADGPGLERLRTDLANGGSWRVLLGPASGVPAGETPEGSVAIAANVVRHSAGHVEVKLPAGATGLLVLSEGYAPGWNATLRLTDDRKRAASVLRANVAFQAVMVDPEVAAVEWRYLPGSFRGGLFLALMAIAGLTAGGLMVRPTRRTRQN